MNETTAQNETANSTASSQTNSNVPDLNVSDLLALKSIIDVASQRGTFKAPELESVGKIYNKLSTFLDHVTIKKD